MQSISHPAFPDHVREVPESDLDDWLEQGWQAAPSVVDAEPGAVEPARATYTEPTETTQRDWDRED